MRIIFRSAACLIGLGWFALVVQAGVVIQQEGGEAGSAMPKQKVTFYVDAGKLRLEGERPDGKKFVMIFDQDKQVVSYITPDEGTYREMSAAQIEGMGQMGQQMSQAMKQMEAQLGQMPPEQRKMVEEMMNKQGKTGSQTLTVQEKGSGEKVGPYTCTHYVVLMNGQPSSEVWAASTDQLHLKEADFKTFQAMAKFYEPLMRNAPKGSWSAPAMQQIQGFPVRTLIYEGQRPAYEWNVVNIEQRPLESSLFTVPSGLKKADQMGGMGMGMGK